MTIMNDTPMKAVQTILKHKPKAAFILGSGLGVLAGQMDEKVEITYEDLDSLPI